MAELIKIYPENPNEREIRKVVKCMKDGGLVIYPTDSVYAIGCDLFNAKALEKIRQIKGVKGKNLNFAIICNDLSDLSHYAKVYDNTVFKIMKKSLPGPFTFVLPASSKVPKIFQEKKKEIGIRVPDNNIPLEMVKMLGNPIITSSIKDEDEVLEYTTDPELIHEKYDKLVDIVIDGGFGGNIPTTVVDCSGSEIEILRQGLGELDW